MNTKHREGKKERIMYHTLSSSSSRNPMVDRLETLIMLARLIMSSSLAERKTVLYISTLTTDKEK